MTHSLAPLLGDDYVSVPSVPVLDEHVLTARDGDVEAVVDAAFLESVAENCNARYEQTGDPVPLCIGHTRDGAPETEQPPIVGYATNFRVGDFAQTGRQALYCDFHVRRERESALRDYPRRSVELWVRKREIDPISLLGATTPERDLGILRYSRRSDPTHFHYRRECPTMTTDKSKYAADADAAMKDAEQNESSGMRELSGKLDKLIEMLAPLAEALAGEAPPESEADEGVGEGSDESGDEDDAEPQGDDLLGPDDDGDDSEMADDGEDADAAAQPPQPAPKGDAKEAAKFRDNPVRFGGPAGGNSTYLPTVSKMQRKDDDVVRMQRQLDAVARENAELKRKYARAEAEAVVKGLEDEGFQFKNRDTDVGMIADLELKASGGSKGWVQHIRDNYKQAVPTSGGSDLFRYAREVDSGAGVSADAFYEQFNKPKLSKAEAEAKLFKK